MQGAVATHSGAGLSSERIQALSKSTVFIKGPLHLCLSLLYVALFIHSLLVQLLITYNLLLFCTNVHSAS